MALNSPRRPRPPEVCPVCGEAVPKGALACPGCGADDRSGWRRDAADIDAEDPFDYAQFTEEEFGSSGQRTRINPVWWVAAVVVILAFGWLALRPFFP